MVTVGSDDYQKFSFTDGKLTDIGNLMQLKLNTLPVEWKGKSLLDVGTDHGFWAFYGAEQGATDVLGLDRGRSVKGVSTDLIDRNLTLAHEIEKDNIDFDYINLGKQWFLYPRYDNVLMLSCYHHVYNNCMDHDAIWYWLWLHTKEMLWWEGPVSNEDPVVQKDVADSSHYEKDAIIRSAVKYFYAWPMGKSAIPGREVWKFNPRPRVASPIPATPVSGAGGASKAFSFENHRRALEIQDVLGFQPVPGSLNLQVTKPFDWSGRYFRVQILDVVDRAKGLESDWAPKWCRFYPVDVVVPNIMAPDSRCPAYAMRFESDRRRYPADFVELIAHRHLRHSLSIPENGGVIRLYQL